LGVSNIGTKVLGASAFAALQGFAGIARFILCTHEMGWDDDI